jgi:hypothetical protein
MRLYMLRDKRVALQTGPQPVVKRDLPRFLFDF